MFWMLRKISSWRTLVLLLVAYAAVFTALVSGSDATSGVVILDLRFAYSVETVYQVLAGLGESGRIAYRTNALTWDILYPIVYSLTFAVVLTLLIGTNEHNNSLRWWTIVPFWIALADLIENLCIAKLVSDYPLHNNIVATLVSWTTPLKWSLAALVIGCIIVLSTQRLVARIRS